MNRWDPFQDASPFQDRTHHAFDRSSGRRSGEQPADGEQIVPINAFEAGDDVMIVAPMPGLQPDDVHIRLIDDMLTLQGRRTPGQEDRQHLLREWMYGPYSRTVRLPFRADPDDVVATLNNGVLTVHLKRAKESRPRRIQVRTTGMASSSAVNTPREE